METNLPDKKWFIYIQDHHEGPFTVKEILDGIAAGNFPADGFVWNQNMADWLPITDVADFKVAPAAAAVAPTPTPVVSQTPVQSEPSFAARTDEPAVTTRDHVQREEPSQVIVQIKPLQKKGKPEPTPLNIEDAREYRVVRPEYVSTQQSDGLIAEPTQEIEYSFGSKKRKREWLSLNQLRAIFLILGLGALGAGLWHHPTTRDSIQAVLSKFSPFPQLSDVDVADYERLKSATRVPLSQGVQLEMAVSKADPLSPTFYVSGNLPEGATLELYVVGVSHTLLNTLEFSGRLEGKLENHLMRVGPLRYADGKVIPRGEYRVFIMESPSGQPPEVEQALATLTKIPRQLPEGLPKDRRLVVEKSIFWGDRDQTYLARLKDFHDKLAQKATEELAELRELVKLLDSQYSNTNSTFDRLKTQTLGPRQLQAWTSSSMIWKQLANQLGQSLQKMNTPGNELDWIHLNLYRDIQAITKKLNELHQNQDQPFSAKIPFTQVLATDVSLRASVEESLLKFKGALLRLEQAPLDANGIPNRTVIDTAPATTPPASSPPVPPTQDSTETDSNGA